MPNNKLILGIVALVAVFGVTNLGQAKEETNQSTSSQAAVVTTQTQEKKEVVKPKTNQVPIVIEAENLFFSDETGEILANGNVVVTNQGQRIEAEQINGNRNLSEIWINDKATFSTLDSNITGSHTLYNYKLKTGSMEQAKGRVENEFVSGEAISMFPDKYTINNGTMTKCPAKIPDYHISADKIEIWPNDKMIAYNAKFWIGKTVIFAMPKYQQSIKEKGKETPFPRIGYDSDDGFYIRQHISYPINNKLSAYADLDYYSKPGFKPNYGLIQSESNYKLGVYQGYFRDDDENWVKKEPEFKFSYYPHRLGRLPVSYTITGIYGKWTDSYKTSWHQEYEVYFSHDPIKLNKTMNLYLGTGFEHIRESYNDSTQNNFKYDIAVGKKWSERLHGRVSYHYTQKNTTLFSYDSDANNRELDADITYKIDKMNTIGITRNYDLDNKKVEDLNYTWYRNLHCWQAAVTYKAKEEKWQFSVTTTRW